MNYSKIKAFGLILCFFFLTNISFGQKEQKEISQAELKNFAEVFQEMRSMGQQIQLKMAKVIQEEGMKVERFQKIHTSRRQPNSTVKPTEKEKKQYTQIISQIQKIQKESRDKMEQLITEGGLTLERYQQIVQQVQKDTVLQKRLRKTIEK